MHRAFGPVELAAFRAIKRAFDPDGLLNPGAMLPAPLDGEPVLAEFADAVARALNGRRTALPLPTAYQPSDTDILIDAENMSLTAGGAALCRDVATAARAAGLYCATMEYDGIVADVIEGAGHRQPACSGRVLVVRTARSPPKWVSLWDAFALSGLAASRRLHQAT